MIGRDGRPVLDLAHRQRSGFCQQLGQDALVLRVEVRDQHEGHAGVNRQTREQLLERFEAAGGGPDADHRDQFVSDLLTFGALCLRVGLGARLSGNFSSPSPLRVQRPRLPARQFPFVARVSRDGAFCFLLIFAHLVFSWSHINNGSMMADIE